MTQGAPDSERSQPSDAAPLPQLPPVRLLMHGEDKAQGGPSLRVPRTAAELRALGYAAQSTQIRSVLDCPEDVAHLFNVWPPNDALRLLRQLKSAGKTVIFSPIYLDLGLHDFWQARLPFMALDDAAAVAEEANRVRAHLGGRGARPEILPGYHGMLREMLRLADHVVFLSAAERAALAEMGASVPDTRASVVPNPVDAALWRDGDPALFRDAYLEPGEDYVVCVGRIEERKNQLLLARALRDTSMRLVLIGRQAHPAYAERVIEEAGDRLILPGRLEPGGAMLRSALAGARAFALPSWCEGTSLAALEAAAAGLPLVLSDLPGERDSFGALAEYCDPGDPASIAAAVMRAAERGPAPEPERAAFAERHSWQQHARATAEAYATALAAPRAAPEVLRAAPSAVVLDVSALSRAEPHSFGSVRAVQRMAEALLEQEPDARCIAWHEAAQVFADIPSRFVKAGRVASYMAGLTGPGVPAASLPHGAVVVLASPVWASP